MAQQRCSGRRYFKYLEQLIQATQTPSSGRPTVSQPSLNPRRPTGGARPLPRLVSPDLIATVHSRAGGPNRAPLFRPARSNLAGPSPRWGAAAGAGGECVRPCCSCPVGPAYRSRRVGLLPCGGRLVDGCRGAGADRDLLRRAPWWSPQAFPGMEYGPTYGPRSALTLSLGFLIIFFKKILVFSECDVFTRSQVHVVLDSSQVQVSFVATEK